MLFGSGIQYLLCKDEMFQRKDAGFHVARQITWHIRFTISKDEDLCLWSHILNNLSFQNTALVLVHSVSTVHRFCLSAVCVLCNSIHLCIAWPFVCPLFLLIALPFRFVCRGCSNKIHASETVLVWLNVFQSFQRSLQWQGNVCETFGISWFSLLICHVMWSDLYLIQGYWEIKCLK